MAESRLLARDETAGYRIFAMSRCASQAWFLLAAGILAIGTERANLRFPLREAHQKAGDPPIAISEAFAAHSFGEWIRRYSEAPTAKMEAAGIELARQRRKEMRLWIETDPQRAWENRISWRERQVLPAAVQAELETFVSGTGDLEVFAATPMPGQTNGFRPVSRTVTVDGRKYETFVYGRRVNQPSGTGVSLHGVALDGLLALSDSPVRLLEPGEPPTPGKNLAAAQCPVSGSNASAAWAESGSQAYRLCSAEHIDALAAMVWQQELQATASLTTGAQAALVLIVDFPNAQGANTTENAALEAMQQVDSFYRANSFGALSIEPVDVTPVLRLPQTSDIYLKGTGRLLSDAVEQAQIMGYEPSNYRFLIVTFVEIGFPWGGLGTVSGNDSFIQGPTFRPDFVEHELGHNLGVWHAGGWLTDDESVIGPGRHIEYGNAFDVMGSGFGHLNGAFKSTLGWLQETNIASATVDGTYRIYALDTGGELVSGNAYSLRIPATPPLHGLRSDYWIDYRQQFVDLGTSSGALIHWATNSVGIEYSHLLDMNPAGGYGFRDAALRIGRTFVDSVRSIYITPVAKGPRWLDMIVKFAPSNASVPTLALNASALTANVGQPIQFTATATDSDGDALAYYWDFDDESVIQTSLNQPSATKSWSFAREYSVRCVVSDLKGGEATASVVVRVGAPATYHVSGTIASIPGVRVHNGLSGSDYRATFTDSQGHFVLAGLGTGSYSLAAAKAGNSFKPLFATPVTVGPTNVDGLQFEPRPPGAPYITGFSPPSGGIGTLVTIDGANFFGLTSVKFGNLSVTFTYESPQRIQARVPSQAVTAPITVSNAAGMDTTGAAFTIIPSAPVITRHPQSQTNRYTTTANFNAAAEGSGPLNFQWRKDGFAIPGATSTTYSITNLQPEHAGVYDFVASNPVGSTASDPARLTLGGAPAIVEQPQSTNVILGQPVVFSVRALGTAPLRYQWYRRSIFNFFSVAISNANEPSYIIPATSDGYQYTRFFVQVSNDFGSLTSAEVAVTFVSPPSVEFVYPRQEADLPIGRIEVLARAFGPLPIQRVELFNYTNKVAEALEAEDEYNDYYYVYRLIFTNDTPGQTLYLTAWVTDSQGHQGTLEDEDDALEIRLYLPLSAWDADWKYLDDGSDPGPNWRTSSFDDQTWKSGGGYFCFGDGCEDTEGRRTPIDHGVTTYFRRRFQVADPAQLSNVVMRIMHTSGMMIAYLNDREILRSGIPTGVVDYPTLAAYDDAQYLRTTRLDSALFIPGENQLAVEVHLGSPDQYSMLFNLQLLADFPPADPEISIVYPQSWQIVSEPQFEILADAIDLGGDITNVTFRMDWLPLAVVETPPYSAIISNLPPFAFCKSSRAVPLVALATDTWPDSALTYPVFILPPGRPGFVNVLSDRNDWNYDDVGVDSDTAWRDFPGPATMPNWKERRTLYAANNASTTRFRKVFDLCVTPGSVGPNSRIYTNLVLYLLTELSDGALVYLNGTEVFRYNLPSGPITNGACTGLPPSVFGYVRADVDPHLLRSTNNIVAVEMHQNQTNSELLVFDLALVGMIQPSFPELRVHRANGSLLLEWDEFYWYAVVVEYAASLNGPWYWFDQLPHSVPIYPDTQRFFRLRWEPLLVRPD